MNGTQLLESSLHKHLIEHLNAEIVLNTITDISVAVEWLKYTFLYIRVLKNPQHYGKYLFEGLQQFFKCNFCLMYEPILMKLYTIVVYYLRLYIREDNLVS